MDSPRTSSKGETSSSAAPRAFLERMAALLGDEFLAFREVYTQPPVTGLRVNTLKLTPEQFRALSPFPLSPLPWCPAGFVVDRPEDEPGEEAAEVVTTNLGPGKHPYHAAGLYYLQEPSAMAVAELLDPQPGERVLDLAAAPGGKATHLAALMGNQGLLVANEIHPRRAWDLAENLERMGVRNAVITNETSERLAEFCGDCFDRVLVDAPCSGEGMFRKSEPARLEWSPELVTGSAARQSLILAAAARLVRPGGRLVYATCTFSPEENEGTLARFLSMHPEFELLEPERRPGFAPGRSDWAETHRNESLQRAVRLWPHKVTGEGHFMALLVRRGIGSGRKNRIEQPANIPGLVLQLYHDFNQEALVSFPVVARLKLVGSYLYHLPVGSFELSGLRVIHPGWWLGTVKKNRFEPAHSLALGLTKQNARQVMELGEDVLAYLRGESLPSAGAAGWILATIAGFPLGWGKRVQGVLKNFYPKGLRWP
jgi:16S rRNA C967 or C1407 C5-methylase (RsmB/RsmF family)/NOL1/NOP2/fmu family ribosome biogenesis protein